MKTYHEILNTVPKELQLQNVWCLWKLERKDGRKTKIPFQPTGAHASSTNPDTWNSLEVCYQALQGGNYNGIGLVLTGVKDVVFVDLDHCLINGEPNEFARSVLQLFPNTYSEVSQSGAGLHILVRGAIPHAIKKPEIELYSTGRYVACTFDSFNGSQSIQNGGQALQDLYQRYTPKAKRKRRAPAPVVLQDDETVLKRACRADSKFADLYAGNWTPYYHSHSEADCALCCKLAFWTDRSEEQINRLFCSSGLYRSKWEREDYRRRTIEFAVNAVGQSYTEWYDEKRLEFSTSVLKNF